jgi:hypothetical protein
MAVCRSSSLSEVARDSRLVGAGCPSPSKSEGSSSESSSVGLGVLIAAGSVLRRERIVPRRLALIITQMSKRYIRLLQSIIMRM